MTTRNKPSPPSKKPFSPHRRISTKGSILLNKDMSILKKLSALLALLLLGMGAYTQDDAIGKYFGKYLDDSRFSVVSVSPKMFRLLSKVNWDTISSDVKQTVSKLQSLRIISTETTPRLFYKEALSRIDMMAYEELISVKDKT